MKKERISYAAYWDQRGFTLIELLIVVAIIGILAAVGVPQYGNYLDRAAVSACQGELASFRSAVLAESSFSAEDSTASLVSKVDISFQSCAIEDAQREKIAELFLDPQSDSTPVMTTRSSADSLEIVSGNIRTQGLGSG